MIRYIRLNMLISETFQIVCCHFSPHLHIPSYLNQTSHFIISQICLYLYNPVLAMGQKTCVFKDSLNLSLALCVVLGKLFSLHMLCILIRKFRELAPEHSARYIYIIQHVLNQLLLNENEGSNIYKVSVNSMLYSSLS